MDRSTNVLLYAEIILLAMCMSASAASFTINKRTSTKDDNCMVTWHIQGKGIDYTVSDVCSAAEQMGVVYIPRGLVLGDYRKDPLCVFTDTPGTLVVMQGTRCFNVTRPQGEDQGKEVVMDLEPSECALVKQKVEQAWNRRNSQAVGERRDVVGDMSLLRRRYVQDVSCTQEFRVEGKGIDTSLAVSCKKAERLQVLHTSQGLVLGDYRKDGVCFFAANSPSTMVIIQGPDKNCFQEFHFQRSEETNAPIDKTGCDSAKQEIAKLWDMTKNEFEISRKIHNKKDGCTEEFIFTGRGIDASIHVKCEIGQELDVLKVDEGFILGDYRSTPLCVFHNNPNILLIIKEQDGFKICTEDTFDGKNVSRKTLFPFDCDDAKQFVVDHWDNANRK